MNLAGSRSVYQQIENALLHQDIEELQRLVKSAVKPDYYSDTPASPNE